MRVSRFQIAAMLAIGGCFVILPLLVSLCYYLILPTVWMVEDPFFTVLLPNGYAWAGQEPEGFGTIGELVSIQDGPWLNSGRLPDVLEGVEAIAICEQYVAARSTQGHVYWLDTAKHEVAIVPSEQAVFRLWAEHCQGTALRWSDAPMQY